MVPWISSSTRSTLSPVVCWSWLLWAERIDREPAVFFDMAYENAGGSIPIGTAVEETEVLLLNAQGDPGQVVGRSPWPAPIWPRAIGGVRS